jgi:hypothetical protein
MGKITVEQFNEIKGLRGFRHPVIDLLNEVSVNEGVFLKHEEWDRKTQPVNYIGQTFREPRSSKKFKVRTLKNGEGWVFLRTK